jgi:aminopeptidase
MQYRFFLQPGFQNLRQIELIEAAKVVIDKCLNVKPGENVAIVTDSMQSWRIAETLAMATNLAGAEYTILCIKPRKSMYGPPEITNPPKPIGGALKDADAAYLMGTTGLIWTDAVQEALKSGCRMLTSPGLSEDNFVRCIMIDYDEVWERTKRVQAFLSPGKHVKLTSPQGSDLTFEIGYPPLDRNNETADIGYQWPPLPNRRGGVSGPGEFDYLPPGVAGIGLKEDTANGTLVIDGSLSRIGVLREPVYLTIRDGRIVDSKGGFEEREMRAALDMFDDPNMYNVSVMGIGTNPSAKFTGQPNEDERVIGMCYFQFGDNYRIYKGYSKAVLYYVAQLTTPRIEIEGTVIVEGGQLKV